MVKHQGLVKWILRYVADTQMMGLYYTYIEIVILLGYTDSDWVGFLDDK